MKTLISKKIRTYTPSVIALIAVGAPFIAFAAIVPCTDNCGFEDLLKLVNNIIDFLLFKISMPLAAVSFAVAGIKMLLARGNQSKVTEAKEIFWYVLWGAIVALSAWLIVKAIVTVLFQDTSYLS